MKVTVENGKIKVNSPYNRDFITRAKQIQGKWEDNCWVFPEENKEQVSALLIECYGECGELGSVNTVTVELDLDLYEEEEGSIKLGAMSVVRRPSRDRDVVFSENAMLISGGFPKSGGSAKYPRLYANDGTILRVKDVPETVYNKIKDNKGVRLISGLDAEKLEAEREKLLKRLAEIDSLLAV